MILKRLEIREGDRLLYTSTRIIIEAIAPKKRLHELREVVRPLYVQNLVHC